MEGVPCTYASRAIIETFTVESGCLAHFGIFGTHLLLGACLILVSTLLYTRYLALTIRKMGGAGY